MRARWLVLVVALGAAMAACSQGPPRAAEEQGPPNAAALQSLRQDVVILSSGTGLTVLDPATGAVLLDAEGAPAFADWSEVVTVTRAGSTTILHAQPVATSESASGEPISGNLTIRVVSGDGRQVALMPPPTSGTSPWTPEPRALTTIVVADPTGEREPIRFRLKGNFDPEAFSTDGRSLFLLRYVPPTAPTAYRVARLDLRTGRVHAVPTSDKSLVETMSGTRLMQIASPDGTGLYTLYTSESAAGYHAAGDASGSAVAFVHTLSLDEGWAHCVGLPRELWGGNPQDEALAISPGGGLLYVVDVARGVVAVMDTQRLRTDRMTEVDFGPVGDGTTHAAVSPDGRTLIVANGTRVVALDTETLVPERSWTTASSVTGLGFSVDGLRLYAAGLDGIEVLDPSSGHRIHLIPTPAGTRITAIAAIDA
jgi:hypothetical protein